MTPTERVQHLERALLIVAGSLDSEANTAAVMGDVSGAKRAANLSTYIRDILEIGADA
jgi:hypothetical protein